MNDEVIIRRVAAAQASAYVEPLAEVLIDCVEGGASVSFMWPLTHDRARAFWRDVAHSVGRGERALLVAEWGDGRVLGTVQVILAQPENQPHRADVAKMLVLRQWRRRGIGRRLMLAADDAARSEGKTVLMLDTVTGGDGERLYLQTGWHRVGVVPDHALMPRGGLCATTFFYKHL